jgi:hypothetical protein
LKPIAYFLFLTALAGSAGATSILTLTLAESTLDGNPGDTLTFIATGLNTAAVTENLNSDSFSVDPPLTLDDSDFLNNWPLSLTAGESFGPSALFSVTIPLGTAQGLYNGTFNILGGPGPNDLNILGSASFTADVAAVPEPGTFALMAIGFAAAVLGRRRA